jgi:hypothetical protein
MCSAGQVEVVGLSLIPELAKMCSTIAEMPPVLTRLLERVLCELVLAVVLDWVQCDRTISGNSRISDAALSLQFFFYSRLGVWN